MKSQGSLRFPQKPATSAHSDSATLVSHVYIKLNTVFSSKRTQDFQIFRIKTFFLGIPTSPQPSEGESAYGLFNPLTPELNTSAQRCMPILFTGILIFKGITARRFYKSFGLKALRTFQSEKVAFVI
jgi:hypothetical protein